MGAYNPPPDLERMIGGLLARVAVLERLRPEDVHLVGATGEPAFQNAWVNFDTDRPAAFYRDRGRVYLTGLIKSGTIGLTAFTLPAGYRPASVNGLIFAVTSNALFGAVAVDSAGLVKPIVGSNVYVSLDGISFLHA